MAGLIGFDEVDGNFLSMFGVEGFDDQGDILLGVVVREDFTEEDDEFHFGKRACSKQTMANDQQGLVSIDHG